MLDFLAGVNGGRFWLQVVLNATTKLTQVINFLDMVSGFAAIQLSECL